ncbi:hypothetical protein ACH34E_11030 [Elizabethkingia anophelis]
MNNVTLSLSKSINNKIFTGSYYFYCGQITAGHLYPGQRGLGISGQHS